MEIIRNETSIKINASAQKIYELTTTPKNWIKLHPATRAVYGPNVDKSAGINDVWIEHGRDIQNPVNATWYVTIVEPYKRWQMKSAFFNGQNIETTITYLYDEKDGVTTFSRIMDTEVAKETSESLKGLFANKTTHIKYLETVKEIVENE